MGRFAFRPFLQLPTYTSAKLSNTPLNSTLKSFKKALRLAGYAFIHYL